MESGAAEDSLPRLPAKLPAGTVSHTSTPSQMASLEPLGVSLMLVSFSQRAPILVAARLPGTCRGSFPRCARGASDTVTGGDLAARAGRLRCLGTSLPAAAAWAGTFARSVEARPAQTAGSSAQGPRAPIESRTPRVARERASAARPRQRSDKSRRPERAPEEPAMAASPSSASGAAPAVASVDGSASNTCGSEGRP